MQLSVIIVNYNVRPFLENALISVKKALDSIEGEVWVIDNASDDGSAEMVRSKFPGVHLVVNEKNLGFAAANNIGLTRSRGEYILLLNPDTIVQEDTFRTMITFFEKNPDVGLAGCKVLNPDGTLQLACRRSFPTPWVAFTKVSGLATLFPKSRLFGRYNLTYLNPDESYEVDAVSGSFMFLRREVFEKTGGFDEQFFMYGEDLDWCYRIQQAGWKVYYVPTTQIIHYKGESAKRSDVDEVRVFYDAMHLFVKKHMARSWITQLILRAGIAMRSWIALLVKASRPLPILVVDWLLVVLSLAIASYLRFGNIFYFPDYAYPALLTVPAGIVLLALYGLGVYTHHRLSIPRAAAGVVIGFVIISALTFFFKEYAFSRIVVAYSGLLSLVLLPSWRIAARRLFRPSDQGGGILGRRTLIVGTGSSSTEVLRKLRTRLTSDYNVVGFIDHDRKRLGEKIAGVEIVGSIDNIGKVISEQKITDVIFSTDTLSYTDILSVIGRSRDRSVNFRLVPSSIEVIIGKTSIDELDAVPLVEIDYRINRPLNRALKRGFDIIVGSILLVLFSPFMLFASRNGRGVLSILSCTAAELPNVLSGKYSLVGRSAISPVDGTASQNGTPKGGPYLGKIGITGLVQLHAHNGLTSDEVEQYDLYYAKNQSLLLDMEILLKAFFQMFRNKQR